MTEQELLDIIHKSEDSKIQFKERIHDNYDIGTEMVAFSNCSGGYILVGVKDKTGEMNPLSYTETQDTNERLSNIATQNVNPGIAIVSESVPVEGGNIVVVSIRKGLNKPYKDNKGIIWTKQGSDKRRVCDNLEIVEMLEESGTFQPDERPVKDSTIEDLDEDTIKACLLNRYRGPLDRNEINGGNIDQTSLESVVEAIGKNFSLEQLLVNLHLIYPDGRLKLTTMLLFGKYPQRWLPIITAKCISFFGNSLGGKEYRDRVNDQDMEGNLLHQYNCIMDFFRRNLRYVQPGKEFNSQGIVEIPLTALSELVVNALVHRSLIRNAPIRIFIFDNRVEIHSPGVLPYGLSVADIENGTSMPRNNFLFSHAVYLLPFFGVGTGIRRALDEGVDIRFKNDERLQEFIITIPRNNDTNNDTPNGDRDTDRDTLDGDRDTDRDTLGGNNDTSKGDRDTDRDTQPMRKKDLTKRQIDIINFCSVPRSAREILDRLGLSRHSKNIKAYITPLVEGGFLQYTQAMGAGNQKYVKVK